MSPWYNWNIAEGGIKHKNQLIKQANPKWTDNTMAKRKRKDKITNNDLQNQQTKTKDRATRSLLITGGECRWSGRVRSSVPLVAYRIVVIVTILVLSNEWGMDRLLHTTSGTYPWSFVAQIFRNGQPSHNYQVVLLQ